MLVPEIILYNTLNDFINLVKTDWNDNTDKTKTLLYSLFFSDDNCAPLQFETYNWYTQAQAIFLATEDDVNELQVSIGYNMERLAMPTIHILMPSDSKGVIDSIGKDEHRTYNELTQTLTIKKEQSFRSVYHLLITSDNNSEVIMIYYFIRAIFLLFHENFDLLGLADMQFTGQDINMMQELTPPHIFQRNISIQIDYVSEVKLNVPKAIVEKINVIFCPKLQQDWNNFNNHPNPNIHVEDYCYYGGGLGLFNLGY